MDGEQDWNTVSDAESGGLEQCPGARMMYMNDGPLRVLDDPSERGPHIASERLHVTATGYDFIYLYRPVRPEGTGKDFYTRFAREVEAEEQPPVIFSIADCLKDYLSDRYSIFYGDGHLTCFKPR